MIEGLDRLGKDTLIAGVQHRHGFHQVLHFSKPALLECYTAGFEACDPVATKREALYCYQRSSFMTMFWLFTTEEANLIANRAHLGECVYAPLYRGYDGGYVFDIEKNFVNLLGDTRLILLTQDFDAEMQIVDDGESFDFTKRREEQDLFIAAFERSKMKHKRMVCVTAKDGGFKDRSVILNEALSD